jgi:hypothetical protein
MKKLFILVVLMVMAIVGYSLTVTDNPAGGSYPVNLKRNAKAKLVTFVLSTVAADTILGQNAFYWRAPFDCKIDSFHMINGVAIAAADTATGVFWRLRGITNNSGTNGDTIVYDSTRAGLGITLTAGTDRKLKGGPDSTRNTMAAGKKLIFTMNGAGVTATVASAGYYFFSFTVVPADKP